MVAGGLDAARWDGALDLGVLHECVQGADRGFRRVDPRSEPFNPEDWLQRISIHAHAFPAVTAVEALPGTSA